MQIARKSLPLPVFTASLGAHGSKKTVVVPPEVLARKRRAVRGCSIGQRDGLKGRSLIKDRYCSGRRVTGC